MLPLAGVLVSCSAAGYLYWHKTKLTDRDTIVVGVKIQQTAAATAPAGASPFGGGGPGFGRGR